MSEENKDLAKECLVPIVALDWDSNERRAGTKNKNKNRESSTTCMIEQVERKAQCLMASPWGLGFVFFCFSKLHTQFGGIK